MWSDTLLAAERVYWMQLGVWALASAVLGTAILGVLSVRRLVAPLLFQFALQNAVWGTIELVVAIVAWRLATDLDFHGATHLANALWLNTGIAIGAVGVGVTITVFGWHAGRRLGAMGAGCAVILHGIALAALHLSLALQIRGI